MTVNLAAFSAIAAFVAAVTGVLNLRIQRRNIVEAVRPELVPLGWARAGIEERLYDFDDESETVKFSKIRNVGKGAAYDIRFGSRYSNVDAPIPRYSLGRKFIPSIAPGEIVEVHSDSWIDWAEIMASDNYGSKTATLHVMFTYVDTMNLQYRNNYQLKVSAPWMEEQGDLAPGVEWSSRQSIRVPLWRIELEKMIKSKARKLKNRFAPKLKKRKTIVRKTEQQSSLTTKPGKGQTSNQS